MRVMQDEGFTMDWPMPAACWFALFLPAPFTAHTCNVNWIAEESTRACIAGL